MKVYLLIMLLFSATAGNAQKEVWKKLIINPALKIDTGFNKNWLHYWYMIKHPDGHFENTIADKSSADDTARHYFTAAITNTHIGSHQISYCNASTYNDDVELHFSGQPPGYNEELVMVIRGNYFTGRYYFQPMVLERDKEVSYQILSQKLVLKKKPVYDSLITGTIEVRFREKVRQMTTKAGTQSKANPAVTYSKIYVLKGRFHTRLDNDISLE